MGLKLSDIQKSADLAVPNLELDYEVKHKNGKVSERTVVLRNVARLPEADRIHVTEVLAEVFGQDESEEEKANTDTSGFRKLSRRIEGAFAKLSNDEQALYEFLAYLDPENGDYDAYLIAICLKYFEVTNLGEAAASASS